MWSVEKRIYEVSGRKNKQERREGNNKEGERQPVRKITEIRKAE